MLIFSKILLNNVLSYIFLTYIYFCKFFLSCTTDLLSDSEITLAFEDKFIFFKSFPPVSLFIFLEITLDLLIAVFFNKAIK